TLFYVISCLIKWQPIIIAPVLVIYMLNISNLREWCRIDVRILTWRVVAPVLIMSLAILAIYGLAPVKAFWQNVNDPFLSGNALNFNWILTHLRQGWEGGLNNGRADYITVRDWWVIGLSKLLFITTYLMSCYMFFKKQKTFPNLIFYAILAFFSY